MGQFQDAVNHTGCAREAKHAACCFEARKAIDELSQTGTIELGDPGKIDHRASMLVVNQLIKGKLQPFALDAYLERSGQFENDYAGLQLFPDDLQGRLPYSCIIPK